MSSLPTLVFLPGLLCDERLWRAQATALADVAVPVVADLTRDDDVRGMAARVLKEAPERFALAALSMGGYVAFEILRQAPERVTRLALFDTSARPESARSAAYRRAAMAAADQGRFKGVTPKLLPQLIHPSRVAGPVGEMVMAMAQRVGKEAFLRQQHAILHRPDSRPLLPAIAIPTLIGVGDADVRTPPALAEEMHASIPNAALHVFAGCGHLPPLEAPEETTDLLRRWLAG